MKYSRTTTQKKPKQSVKAGSTPHRQTGVSKEKTAPQARPVLPSWAKAGLFIVGVVVIIVGTGVWYYAFAYEGKVLPGVELGERRLAGLNQNEVEELLDAYLRELDASGIGFRYEDTTVSVTPVVRATTSSDLAYPLITFDNESTVMAAMRQGRQGSSWNRTVDFVRGISVGTGIQPSMTVDTERLLELLRENFSQYETPALNPRPAFTENGGIDFLPERPGEVFDYDTAIVAFVDQLQKLSREEIELKLTVDDPDFTLNQVSAQASDVEGVSARFPWSVHYENYHWTLEPETTIAWLSFQPDEAGKIGLGLDPNAIGNWLSQTAAVSVNRPAQEARFTLENNRVTEFQVGTKGQSISLPDTLKQMKADLLLNPGADTQIMTDEIDPATSAGDLNDLGIAELIGTGRTSFAGSPPNRVHNITIGADTLNGILIPPGEEFSLVKSLGAIDATNGYKKELVIKGNKTIPEYGGGLCQIGTTYFRSVLDAGLPITARTNHSYRVSYYEPPIGMDATIYDPAPDFKFMNDTGHHLLLQTRIEGTDIIFDLYGTPDGRTSSTTEPRAFNFVSPPATVYIETEDLAPGVVNCTEKPHTGADAEFTYTVVYPNGEEKAETFKSHYKALPEVCFRGKTPEVETPPEETGDPESVDEEPAQSGSDTQEEAADEESSSPVE
ncbi:MAG: VanW family protein [bacterium]|nr:VanW family protein [bacterium]